MLTLFTQSVQNEYKFTVLCILHANDRYQLASIDQGKKEEGIYLITYSIQIQSLQRQPTKAMYINKTQVASSRMAEPDQPIRTIEIPCRYHTGSVCLNYCHEISCFKLLCEQCIQEHLEHHKKSNLPISSIKSFKKIREGCVDKLNRLIDELFGRMATLKQPKNPQQILEQANMKFEAIKKLMFDIIEQELAKFYEQLRVKVNQSFSTLKNLEQVHENLSKIINQLKQSKTIIIEGLKQIPETVEKILAMNENLYIDTFSREAAGYAQKLAYVDFDVTMNQGKFKSAVSQCLRISRNDAEDMNNSSGEFGKMSKVNINKPLNINTSFNNTPANRSRAKSDNNFYQEKQSYQSVQVPLKLQSNLNYLHFFETGSSLLHLIDISNPQSIRRQRVPLQNYVVPSFYASIMIAQGYIFISGGIIEIANEQMKSDRISRYYLKSKNTQTFKRDFAKVRPRSSHSICECGEYLYILGGYGTSQTDQIEAEKTVERVNIRNGEVEQETRSKNGGANISVALNNNLIIKASEEGVQVYNISFKKWATVQVPDSYVFVRGCGWARTAKDTLFIYGGYNDEQDGVDTCRLWTVTQNELIVKNSNIRLPHREGFLNNTGTITDGCLYALQNIIIQLGNEENEVEEGERTLLRFDGNTWRQLKI